MKNYNSNNPLYLDYNSTTPVHEAVLEEMLPWFTGKFGNPASHTHAFGWAAAEVVRMAREQIATLIDSEPDELIFTSGATEAINLAIKGVFEAYASKGKHVVSFQSEHKAVIDTLDYLEKKGAEITMLPVGEDGLPDMKMFEESIRQDTILVIAMAANNETGVIFPLKEMAEIIHQKKSIFLCDGTQACGKILLNVNTSGIDLLAISAHKFYGPKGTGALFVRRKSPRVTLIPLQHGGGHEKGLRSGTLNVPGIVGMGKAAEIATADIESRMAHAIELRELLEAQLTGYAGVLVNGDKLKRLPNTSNLCFPGIRADQLFPLLPELAFSAGSACSSAHPEPSHVLHAMGYSKDRAFSSVRISTGIYTTKADILFAADKMMDALKKGNF